MKEIEDEYKIKNQTDEKLLNMLCNIKISIFQAEEADWNQNFINLMKKNADKIKREILKRIGDDNDELSL